MSSASGQGVIRYAIMVDDSQAERATTTFKNNLTQLGAATTKTQSTIQTFNATISKQATAFTSSINPIKQQGAALATLTTNLKTQTTQVTTLGTKVKDTASKFSGFATGLSATTSGVLQLAAGFRDYGDAQIAVDKQTRKLSLATEAQHKAQDKLNSLTSKGIKSGKEYQQAQLDVTQANQQLEIQTQLLGERQEDMFDAQSQFVASVIPTTLGAVGTLGSAFKDLGGTKGLGGLVDKFKGLGGTFAPLITGFTGLGTSSKGAVPGIDAATFSLKGLALTAGTVAAPLLAAWTAFDIVPKLIQLRQDAATKGDIAAPLVERLKARRDEINKLLEPPDLMSPSSWGAALARLGFSDVDIKKFKQELGDLEGQIKVLESTTGGATITEGGFAAQMEKSNAAALKLNATAKKSTSTWVAQSKEMQTAGMSSIDASNAYLQVHDAIIKTNPVIAANIIKTKEQNQIQIETAKALKNLPPEFKTSATFAQLFGDKTTVAAAAMTKFQGEAAKDDGMTSFQAALDKGNTDFNTFIDTTQNAIITNKAYRERLIANISSQVDFANASQMSTSELELHNKAVEGDTDAIKQLNEALTNAASQGFSKILQGAEKFLGKKFDKLGFKDTFDRVEKEVNKFSGKFVQAMDKGGFEGGKAFAIKFAETPKKFIKPRDVVAFDELIKWINANAGLPADEFVKQLGARWNELAPEAQTAFGQLMAGFPDVAGQIGTDVGTQMGTATVAAFRKATDKKLFPQKGTMLGPLVGEKGGFNKDFKQTTPADTIQKTIITADNSQALAVFGETKRAWDKVADQISKKISMLTANSDQALGTMGELKRGWDKVASQIEKKIPKINANSDKALDVIGELKRAWDKTAAQIEKKVPKLTVNADQALDMIGEVTRGLQKIKDKNVTITEKHVEIAQGGMHKLLAHDTLIQAHKGEEVDIWPAGIKGNSRHKPTSSQEGSVRLSGRGQGGIGGTEVMNISFKLDGNEILRTTEFKRQIKRESGSNLWTHGA